MAEIRHRELLDTVTQNVEYWKSQREKDKIQTPDRLKILGLKYRKGQKVFNKVTKKEVEIIGGVRTIVGFRSPRGERP